MGSLPVHPFRRGRKGRTKAVSGSQLITSIVISTPMINPRERNNNLSVFIYHYLKSFLCTMRIKSFSTHCTSAI